MNRESIYKTTSKSTHKIKEVIKKITPPKYDFFITYKNPLDPHIKKIYCMKSSVKEFPRKWVSFTLFSAVGAENCAPGC